MNMVERVEQALRANYLATCYPDVNEHWRDMAIAAIQAMHQPSLAMLSAADDMDSDRHVARGRALDAWTRMIDAALEGK